MILEKNIDIIIPVYNEGELILETINSINQNFKLNCNIIICYDFDEDNTLKAIKKSNLNKENIIFLKNKLKGAHGAVMTGIKESKSELVEYQDSIKNDLTNQVINEIAIYLNAR